METLKNRQGNGDGVWSSTEVSEALETSDFLTDSNTTARSYRYKSRYCQTRPTANKNASYFLWSVQSNPSRASLTSYQASKECKQGGLGKKNLLGRKPKAKGWKRMKAIATDQAQIHNSWSEKCWNLKGEKAFTFKLLTQQKTGLIVRHPPDGFLSCTG
jgi:hypothetical protein